MAAWLGQERVQVPEGELRLLSAWEVLDARREGDALAGEGGGRTLCRNACLIARALERRGKAVFESGEAVLDALRAEDIGALAEEWARFNREWNPSPLDGEEEIQRRKKAWSTRVMSTFNGACSVRSALCPRRSGQNR